MQLYGNKYILHTVRSFTEKVYGFTRYDTNTHHIPSMHNGLSMYLDTTIGSSVGIWLGYKMPAH